MRVRKKAPLVASAFVIVLIVASFVWQMLHGMCPVP
jgi:hypothetical protein